MKYGFIDMHIHTNLSNEKGCNLSVKQTFDIILQRLDKVAGKNSKALISIADHNSALSSLEAKKLLKTSPYKERIDFVNGIEFTASLEDDNNSNILKNIYSKCHILMYNYDENNAELQAYSYITHKMFGSDCNFGLQLIALKKKWGKKGLKLTFSDLVPVAQQNSIKKAKAKLFEIIQNKLNDSYTGGQKTIQNLKKDFDDYITHGYNQNAKKEGRLSLKEISDLSRLCGGDLFWAHPTITKYQSDTISSIKDQQTKQSALFLFWEELNSIADIKGIELFYPDAFKHGNFGLVYSIAKRNKLFLSAGSDYHGPEMLMDKRPGNVLNSSFVNEAGLGQTYLTSLAYLDKIKEGSNVGKLNFSVDCSKSTDISPKEFIKIAFKSSDGYYYKLPEKSSKLSKTSELQKHFIEICNINNNLISIAGEGNNASRLKKLVDVNQYIADIMHEYQIFIQKITRSAKDHTKQPEWKLFVRKYKDAKKLCKGILNRNIEDIKCLRSDVNASYIEEDGEIISALEKFFGITANELNLLGQINEYN